MPNTRAIVAKTSQTQARSVACPECGAASGVQCLGANGITASSALHVARFVAYNTKRIQALPPRQRSGKSKKPKGVELLTRDECAEMGLELPPGVQAVTKTNAMKRLKRIRAREEKRLNNSSLENSPIRRRARFVTGKG